MSISTLHSSPAGTSLLMMAILLVGTAGCPLLPVAALPQVNRDPSRGLRSIAAPRPTRWPSRSPKRILTLAAKLAEADGR